MASNYKRLGNYIQQVDVRNTDLSVELLLGVSIEKKFIDSHANTIGTDFSKYKIVKRGQFAYGPVTSRNGDKVSIALLEDADACLISSSYTPFEISKPKELNEEYLMMLFRNPEFDRYARYNSWGSAREVFSWDDFCDLKVNIPSIEEQQKIVRQYKTIGDRLSLLKKTRNELYKVLENEFTLIKKESEYTEELGLRCSYVKDKRNFSDISSQEYVSTENMLANKEGINSFSILENDSRVTYYQSNDILISNIRPYFKKIYYCQREGGCDSDVLCIRANTPKDQYLIFSALYDNDFFDYVMTTVKGTKMPRGDKEDIMKYQIPLLKEKELTRFNRLSSVIHKQIYLYNTEMDLLKDIQRNMTITL